MEKEWGRAVVRRGSKRDGVHAKPERVNTHEFGSGLVWFEVGLVLFGLVWLDCIRNSKPRIKKYSSMVLCNEGNRIIFVIDSNFVLHGF